MGFGIAPASDGEVGDSGAVLGSDDSEEGVQGGGVFDSEGVAGVQNWLSFGIDGAIEKENIGREDGSHGGCGGV